MIYSTESVREQSARRTELVESLQGRGHHLNLEELMERLGLSDHFGKYTAATAEMLMPAALRAPALVNSQLLAIKDNVGDQATQATPSSLARAFRDIWDSVRHTNKAEYPVAEPNAECRFSDQQARLEPCVSQQVSPDVLGKMADFAQRAWETQPIRLFVPFFYLHGPDVSLVLFARSGYYCAVVGRLFHTSSDPSTDDVCDIEDTLRYLWFLLTLPSDRFGHIVDVSVPATGLKFTKLRGSPIAAVDASKGDVSALDYLQRIPLSVSLLDFQSHIFKTQYHGQPAMLKLVWTPTFRLPEAAMYDWLLINECSAVPEVYESSIIASDVFGYRLEYLLLEDCGVPLLEHFTTAYVRDSDTSRRDADAERIFKQLASCLAIAHVAEVSHYDISAENITVCDGNAFIFDWTHAQTTARMLPVPLACALEGKWGLSVADLQPLRWPREEQAMQQTPIYASIRSLWHGDTYFLLDRFESLFYVILHALHLSNRASVATPSPFKLLDFSTMALVKTGCLADFGSYLDHFDIGGCELGRCALLDTVRKFLHFPDGVFIGSKLIDRTFERRVHLHQAKEFLCEQAFITLCPEYKDSGSSPVVATAAVPAIPATTPAAKAVSKTPAIPATTVPSTAPTTSAPLASDPKTHVVPATITATPAAIAVAPVAAATTTKAPGSRLLATKAAGFHFFSTLSTEPMP
ncbi:hypothetical protein GGF42_000745 [Coemansia sp. RSA 2424]|nr:hypothetical protein GGF42_000745 [Coemansia sp. RSA 2424]